MEKPQRNCHAPFALHLEQSCGPKSAPLFRMGRGIYPAGMEARERRIRKIQSLVRSATALRTKVRARAPVRAYTERGASPRQAERSPACNRRLLRRGDTRWGAAGGEQPVRNSVTCRT